MMPFTDRQPAPPSPTVLSAVVQEMFSGIQGEGVLVGVRQVFLRFHGCHLACRYCDTPASHTAPPLTCTAELHAGRRDWQSVGNPLTLPVMLDLLRRLYAMYPHHSVSLTGGEPLLHRPFLDVLLPALDAEGIATYLETNGALPEAMAALTVPPQYIAMDVKLPSTAGITVDWARQGAFLDAALTQAGHLVATGRVGELTERVQVKLVFGEESLEEIAQAAQVIAACRADVPCVLQPVTTRPGGPAAPRPPVVLEAQRLAAMHLTMVRVIPQTHVMLGQW